MLCPLVFLSGFTSTVLDVTTVAHGKRRSVLIVSLVETVLEIVKICSVFRAHGQTGSMCVRRVFVPSVSGAR